VGCAHNRRRTERLVREHATIDLRPDGDGTRLRVTESGFAQLPIVTRSETYDSHNKGWSRELAELVGHIDGA
jgi:hypothetical protein